MKLTGFTDEAARDLDGQIKVAQALGWSSISARMIDGTSIHELSEDDFNRAFDQLGEANISVAEVGSTIANWGKKIDSDFQITIDEINRCIPRMHKLGTKLVRIMSYAQEPWGQDQNEQERFRRLREIVLRFQDAGLTAVHENCMNWGGFSAEHTLRLIEEVPGLKLVFDTGNPVFQRDRSKPEGNQPHSYPWQDAYAFYQAVKPHIEHIHIKDCRMHAEEGEPEYLMPGEGDGAVREIVTDLKASGYDGYIAIEPHVATVFHVKEGEAVDWQQCYESFVAYGQKMQAILDELV